MGGCKGTRKNIFWYNQTFCLIFRVFFFIIFHQSSQVITVPGSPHPLQTPITVQDLQYHPVSSRLVAGPPPHPSQPIRTHLRPLQPLKALHTHLRTSISIFGLYTHHRCSICILDLPNQFQYPLTHPSPFTSIPTHSHTSEALYT